MSLYIVKRDTIAGALTPPSEEFTVCTGAVLLAVDDVLWTWEWNVNEDRLVLVPGTFSYENDKKQYGYVKVMTHRGIMYVWSDDLKEIDM